jgi:hypothetical protein
MDDLVIRHRPTLCFIECMTGDMGVGLQADTGAALEGMLRKLEAIDCAACFLNLPRRGEDFSAANPVVALYARIAGHHGVASVDLGPVLSAEGDDFFRDAVHTTPAGALRTAELICAALERLFQQPDLPNGPQRWLFERDFSRAAALPARLEWLGGEGKAGRFRLAYPYVEFGPGSEMSFSSPTLELLGLLLVVGPHSGSILIGGEPHQLRDRWSHYERLHSYVLQSPIPPGAPVSLTPLDEGAPRSVKLVGLLTRPG